MEFTMSPTRRQPGAIARTPQPTGASDFFKPSGGSRAYRNGMAPRFDAIGLAVADMSRTLTFYRALGLEFPDGAETAPHAEATLPGGLRLMLDPVETGQHRPSGEQQIGLAFVCDTPADVDKTYAEMVSAGHAGAKEPWDAEWGQRYASLQDPDGNQVDLFAWL
jgi:catechol 2,3-dioxygenase-like lactoylglutathione lyase family enzyme